MLSAVVLMKHFCLIKTGGWRKGRAKMASSGRQSCGVSLMSEGTINNPRAEIDAIDRELLRLLNERAEIALRVGAAKAAGETPLCDPNREKEVLSCLRQENKGPFDERS